MMAYSSLGNTNSTADQRKPSATTHLVPTPITYIERASENDLRGRYEAELLKLTLDKTAATYGPYELKPAPQGVNNKRSRKNMKTNRLPNFVRSFAYRATFTNDPNISHIPFPIYLGILSYRICFVSAVVKDEVAASKGFEQLLTFNHGQGMGWVDSQILRHNGFKVTEVSNYDSLFKITALNRVDLFCRGINEYLKELETHRSIPGLAVDESFALYYPMPVYFYSNHTNQHILTRIEHGLKMASSDGSLLALWKHHFMSSIEKAKLSQRRIYPLENHTLPSISPEIHKQFYQPPGIPLNTLQTQP